MRKFLLLTVFVLFIKINSFAQFDFGLTLGYNYNLVNVIADESKMGEYASQNKSGYHFTSFFRFKHEKTGLYAQLEPTYTKYNTAFGMTLNNRIHYNEIESNRFDLPLLVGIKMGPVRVFGGPVASWNLKSVSSVLSYDLATINENKFAYGYQMGIGFEVQRLIIDIKYEGAIDHVLSMNYNGQDFGNLINHGNQITVSLGLKLF